MHSLSSLCFAVHFLRIVAHAEYHPYVAAVDDGRGTTTTYQGQRLACHGEEAYGYHHIDGGLRYQHQRTAHHQEGREVAPALLCYLGRSYEQDDIEKYHKGTTHKSQLLDDDSKDEVGICLRQIVTLHGVARATTNDIARCNGYRGMSLLEVLIGNLELRSRHRLRITKTLYTSLPSGQTIESGDIAQRLAGHEEQYGEEERNSCPQHQHQLAQLPQRDTSYIHHQEHHAKEQHGSREVLRCNESAHDTRHPQYPLHGIGRGSVLRLHTREDERRTHDHAHLSKLGGLDGKARNPHPAGSIIDIGALKQHIHQQTYRHRHQHQRYGFIEAIRDEVRSIHHHTSQQQVGTMLTDRPPVVTPTLISKHTGRTEHLNYRDEQEQHKHYPYDLVATKYSIQEIHCFYYFVVRCSKMDVLFVCAIQL